MWYHIYEAQKQASEPFRAAALAALKLRGSLNGAADSPGARRILAALEMTTRATLTHTSPPFGIKSVKVENREALVTEEVALDLPFANMLHFRKDIDAPQPKVLIVAPLSGHFATLLRATAKTMLQDHDVYITDWKNARDIPLTAGRFGFEDYVDYLIKMLEHLGPGAHVVAVCQPCVQALVATSVMAANKHPCEPRSLTLMAGPIDCRINPTAVNTLATEHPIEWFRNNLISTVPFPLPGWGRRVYPGFMQLTAFMSMNPQRHIDAHKNLFQHLVEGDETAAETIKTFYDEYFAVLDLTEDFYLETVAWVFQEMRLPTGRIKHRGEVVDPSAIRKTALLTVEGERDDICAVGQTAAAHELVTKLRPHLRSHHLQPGVGHYGVFAGRRWENQIYPTVRSVILSTE
ncbi:MAG TPA: polyhydroxyalkanoate depolymerase [Hyphomonadaceae bacterium]|jgi:polyhydroxyalkanoate depolymerase|nr:polyhydroxyalkanoate depolymerase [Hyphomonadaceae bacterium]